MGGTKNLKQRPEKSELREGGYFDEAKLIVLRELWREKKGLRTSDEGPFHGQA
jgi:hypothetical protein